MKEITRLLLGIMLSLSIVFAGASDVLAEMVRGVVKQTAPEAQLFTLRVNDDKLLLVSWNRKTAVKNLNSPAEIKADDYLVVDLFLQGEQLVAATINSPPVILPAGVATIPIEQLDAVVAGDQTGQALTLVDTRPASKFAAGHIPGARSIPLARIVKRTAGLLPEDKNAPIVFYDDGVEAADAVKAVELTSASGYSKVMLFKEGVRGWVKSGRFLASSPTFIRKNKPALIDLRTADAVRQGHLAGAVNCPLAELPQMYGNLPVYRLAPIVVYGESDRDALAGAAIIRKWGYRNVTFLSGGTSTWQANAEPLESGPAAERIYSVTASHSGQLLPQEFKSAVRSPQTVEIVDVRSDADYRKGHLSTGVHIPLSSIVLRYNELSREKIQVIFAADAERAEMAFDFLAAKGFRVSFLEGTVEFGNNGAYTVK